MGSKGYIKKLHSVVFDDHARDFGWMLLVP